MKNLESLLALEAKKITDGVVATYTNGTPVVLFHYSFENDTLHVNCSEHGRIFLGLEDAIAEIDLNSVSPEVLNSKFGFIGDKHPKIINDFGVVDSMAWLDAIDKRSSVFFIASDTENLQKLMSNQVSIQNKVIPQSPSQESLVKFANHLIANGGSDKTFLEKNNELYPKESVISMSEKEYLESVMTFAAFESLKEAGMVDVNPFSLIKTTADGADRVILIKSLKEPALKINRTEDGLKTKFSNTKKEPQVPIYHVSSSIHATHFRKMHNEILSRLANATSKYTPQMKQEIVVKLMLSKLLGNTFVPSKDLKAQMGFDAAGNTFKLNFGITPVSSQNSKTLRNESLSGKKLSDLGLADLLQSDPVLAGFVSRMNVDPFKCFDIAKKAQESTISKSMNLLEDKPSLQNALFSVHQSAIKEGGALGLKSVPNPFLNVAEHRLDMSRNRDYNSTMTLQ